MPYDASLPARFTHNGSACVMPAVYSSPTVRTGWLQERE